MEVSCIVEKVREVDQPEDSLLSIRYSNHINAIYSISHHDSSVPAVEIESLENLASVETALEKILSCVIRPHERFSYKFHIHILSISGGIFNIYTDLVAGLTVLMVSLGIELTDTLISYTKEYSEGSVWVCKKYFTNEVACIKLSDATVADSLERATEHIPVDELEELKYLCGSVGVQ
ncbi:hypothetical protein NEIG_01321 [Nematocida sp. ERTm5]|nr:hypothetical protein NEIG_01321 [Nematocida sp. ERTm5]